MVVCPLHYFSITAYALLLSLIPCLCDNALLERQRSIHSLCTREIHVRNVRIHMLCTSTTMILSYYLALNSIMAVALVDDIRCNA